MNRKIVVYILALITLLSCSQGQIPEDTWLSPIRLAVVTGEAVSRAYMYDDDLSKEQEFGLNAYLMDGADTKYLDGTWVFYAGNGWYFRDQTYQGKLLDYYWPNDHSVNFVAYMPYQMDKSVVTDFGFTDDGGVAFDCDLATSGSNRTVDDKKNNTREIKHEFVYAYRHDCDADDGVVNLRFVHPLAAVKFKLSQSHRNLTIHSITLSGLSNRGTYTNENDTYANYLSDQDALTYTFWTPNSTKGSMTIEYEKSVPTDINYYSLIGGPYLVIPQELTGVELSLNYSWDDVSKKDTEPKAIIAAGIEAWQPGMIYTYTLNLGDNKEEILFKATVEPWTKGEDEGYENQYDVK